MSVADRKDREQAETVEVDLTDLGTVNEAELRDARAAPQRAAERRAAIDALDTLERDGRLLLS